MMSSLHNVEFCFKLKRIEPGLYESICGRVLIKKFISSQTYRPDETVWEARVDGYWLCGESTKRDAMYAAQRVIVNQGKR